MVSTRIGDVCRNPIFIIIIIGIVSQISDHAKNDIINSVINVRTRREICTNPVDDEEDYTVPMQLNVNLVLRVKFSEEENPHGMDNRNREILRILTEAKLKEII